MTDKEELIKSAETFKKYCDKIYPDIDCTECICYLPICFHFEHRDDLRDVMSWFIDEVKRSDD